MKDRRERILEAAERIFATKGYHEAGIADIAADLGMGHGTFYRYFANKHDIATTVMERVVARFADAGLVEDPEAADSLDEYRAQTERILGRMLELVETHPTVVRFFHHQALAIDPDRLTAVLDAYCAFTARFLRNGIAKGFLRPDLDVEPTAQALVGLIFEGTRRALHDDGHRRQRWVDAGVALMFDGIRR